MFIFSPTAASVGGTTALTYETVFSTKETHITGLLDTATNQEESIKQEYKVSNKMVFAVTVYCYSALAFTGFATVLLSNNQTLWDLKT